MSAESGLWLVLKAYPWEALEVHGGGGRRALRGTAGEPTHLVPAFRSREAAVDWADDGDRIMRFDEARK